MNTIVSNEEVEVSAEFEPTITFAYHDRQHPETMEAAGLCCIALASRWSRRPLFIPLDKKDDDLDKFLVVTAKHYFTKITSL